MRVDNHTLRINFILKNKKTSLKNRLDQIRFTKSDFVDVSELLL